MAGKLQAYRAKRDFEKTKEPSDAIAVAPSNRLRFVIMNFWSWRSVRRRSTDKSRRQIGTAALTNKIG